MIGGKSSLKGSGGGGIQILRESFRVPPPLPRSGNVICIVGYTQGPIASGIVFSACLALVFG